MIGSNTSWGSAVGGGTTGPFSIPFPLYNQSQLMVIQVISSVPATKYLGIDYTFTAWSPDNKGQVAAPEITFTSNVTGGALLVFILMPPVTQLTQFSAGPYSPGAEEASEDLATQVSQMLYERVAKSVRVPDYEQSLSSSQTLPALALRASQLMGQDANGNLTMYPLGGSSSQVTSATLPAVGALGAWYYLTDTGQMAWWNAQIGAYSYVS